MITRTCYQLVPETVLHFAERMTPKCIGKGLGLWVLVIAPLA